MSRDGKPPPAAVIDISQFFPESAAAAAMPPPEERAKFAERSGKSLADQLKENKALADAEWADRHKNQGPKALDEDDAEFLENRNLVLRRQELDRAAMEKVALAEFYVLKATAVIGADIDELLPIVPKQTTPPPIVSTKPPPVQVKVIVKPKQTQQQQKPAAVAVKRKIDQVDEKTTTTRQQPAKSEALNVISAYPDSD